MRSPSEDAIHVTGIRAYGYVGYLPEEQVLGQWFQVDLSLSTDLAAAGNSDDIAHTVDYRQAIATTQTLIRSSKFALLEALAAAIADAILEQNRVERVRVRLTKLAPPIPDFDGNIAIEIVRSRS